MERKFFFGWSNCKWFIKEIVNIYSNKESYFSKKRIESGAAFAIAQFGMITYFMSHLNSLIISDIILWSATEFAIAGYVVNQIQKEKHQNETPTT